MDKETERMVLNCLGQDKYDFVCKLLEIMDNGSKINVKDEIRKLIEATVDEKRV